MLLRYKWYQCILVFNGMFLLQTQNVEQSLIKTYQISVRHVVQIGNVCYINICYCHRYYQFGLIDGGTYQSVSATCFDRVVFET